ncbi:MAG: cupredoxin domain-containing protein [Opitutales bacterium]
MKSLSVYILLSALLTGLQAAGTPDLAQRDSDSDGKPDREIVVKGTEFSFSPDKVEIKPGETVQIRFVNAGRVAHNLNLVKLGKKTETIQAGKKDSFIFSIDEPGKYQFVCKVPGHKQAGMKGTLVVQENEP